MINFITLQFKFMKKIILSITIVTFIAIGLMSTVKANPVTFYVNITLTDNCLPSPYTGSYCVRLTLTYFGTPVCTAQRCDITGSGCWSFTCDFDPVLAVRGYAVSVVTACRYPSITCSTSTGSSGLYYWNQMIDQSNCPCALSITL
jgi:hypothetical protein